MYFYSDGELVSYYKGMLSKAATKAGAPPEMVAEIDKLELKKMAAKMDLDGDKLVINGNSETSDLSPVLAYFQKMGAPHLEFTVKGANLDLQAPEGAEGKVDVKVFFENFMPGKNEAEIKEAMGLSSSAKVSMEASADDTKLVAVEVPELKVEGKLAEVQEAGQKLLGVSPADVASGSTGGGGGGGNKWGLIALGLLLVAGVGGFMMFGKK